MATTHGFDISHLDNIDWKTISPDFQFVICKKSEGATYTDPLFDYRYHNRQPNLLYGFYHFMKPGVTVDEQLSNYLNGLDLTGCLPPILDAEVEGITIEMVTAFLSGLKQATGRKPILYCDPSFYRDNLHSTDFDCYYWIAAWQPEPPHIHWDIWQYSQFGTQQSKPTGGNLDLDVFNGTLEEMKAL